MDAGNLQQDPLVLDLIRRILDQRDELLTEIRLADSVCYSVTHIRRVFYAAMGESLGDFMRRLRLERAAGMLSLGNRPIVDIALAANYQSGEAFARASQVPEPSYHISDSEPRRSAPTSWLRLLHRSIKVEWPDGSRIVYVH